MFLRIQFSTRLKKEKLNSDNFEILCESGGTSAQIGQVRGGIWKQSTKQMHFTHLLDVYFQILGAPMWFLGFGHLTPPPTKVIHKKFPH